LSILGELGDRQDDQHREQKDQRRRDQVRHDSGQRHDDQVADKFAVHHQAALTLGSILLWTKRRRLRVAVEGLTFGRVLACFGASADRCAARAPAHKVAAMHKDRLSSRFVIGSLSAAGAALVAAFVLAPAALLGREVDLSGGVRRALVEFRESGRPRLPTRLKHLVDYWFEWHAIKVVITSFMLVTFGLLTAALWRRYRHGAAGYAVAAVGASVLTSVAAALLILNIQATVVPLVALLPLASGDASEKLLGPAGSPALTVLVGEVERYYWVMVGVAGTALAVAALISALSWKRRVTDDGRVFVARRATSVVAGLTASLLLLVVAFSTYSAIEPADALRGLLGMG
jgi:hypothetical protein